MALRDYALFVDRTPRKVSGKATSIVTRASRPCALYETWDLDFPDSLAIGIGRDARATNSGHAQVGCGG